MQQGGASAKGLVAGAPGRARRLAESSILPGWWWGGALQNLRFCGWAGRRGAGQRPAPCRIFDSAAALLTLWKLNRVILAGPQIRILANRLQKRLFSVYTIAGAADAA